MLAQLQVAAPSWAASMLSQKPLMSSELGTPNVMLMMDDSNSMMYDWLPGPSDFALAQFELASSSGWITVPTNSGTTIRRHVGDVVWENHLLNPIYYNPTVTYKPWNDNNKAAGSNFPPAATDVNGPRVDPRFIQDGASRYPNSTATTGDIFARPSWDRTIDTCTTQVYGAHNETTCTPSVVPESPSVCTTTSVMGYYCSAPEIIGARYTILEGDWTTDRYDPARHRLIEIDRNVPARLYDVPVDPRTGVQPRRADCVAEIRCTFAEESQNFANWYTYHRTRLLATIGTTAEVLSNLSAPIRMGYGRINYFNGAPGLWPSVPSTVPTSPLPALDGVAAPGHVVRGVRSFDVGSADRQEVFDWLFTLNGVAGTPNREALDAAGRYFSRSDSRGPWSNNPGVGPGGGTADKSCRRSYTILATDGVWTDYPSGLQPRITSMYSSSGGTPVESDNINGPLIAGGGTQAGRSYQYQTSVEPVFGASGGQNATLTDVAHYYWSRDLRPDLINNNAPVAWPGSAGTYPGDYFDPSTWQNMRTMIIAYGLTSPFTNDQVKDAMRNGTGLAWPSVDVSSDTDYNKVRDSQRAAFAGRGAFFSAPDSVALSQALAEAFATVSSVRSSSAGVGVSSAIITGPNDLVFEAGYQTNEWVGSLSAIEALGLINGTRTVRWTASVPRHDLRAIYTSTSRLAAVPFQWASLSTPQQTALGTAATVDYLRGDTSSETPVGTYRKRAGPLGTIVQSSPVYSKATNYGFQVGPTAGGTGYSGYVTSKAASRTAAVFVNANDGMFHAFAASDGTELFSYVPRAVIPTMATLGDPNYEHRYLVDGQVSEGDIYDGGWKTVVVGTGGAGPISMFALDVTNPSAFTAGRVRFDLTAADVPDLGHIMGRVLIASTRSGKWVAITGNGYESANDRAVLLVIDLADGSVIKRIDTGVGNATQRNGLGPVTALYDGKRDVTAVYAGDKLGNLWKFDLSSANVADWGVAGGSTPLFTATTAGLTPQPITTEVRLSEHPAGGLYVAFGTGKFFETTDEANSDIQSLYFLRDVGDGAAISRSSLKQANLGSSGGGEFRTISGLSGGSGLDWSVHKGWYMDLRISGSPGNGERIIAAPVMSNGKALFTSFRPSSADPCISGGDSFLYTIDLATGLQREAYDTMGVNVIARQLTEGVPGGLVPLYVPPAPGPSTVSSISSSQLGTLINAPRYTTSTVGSVTGGGRCSGVGTGIRSASTTVAASCAGVIPMRTWRDMR